MATWSPIRSPRVLIRSIPHPFEAGPVRRSFSGARGPAAAMAALPSHGAANDKVREVVVDSIAEATAAALSAPKPLYGRTLRRHGSAYYTGRPPAEQVLALSYDRGNGVAHVGLFRMELWVTENIERASKRVTWHAGGFHQVHQTVHVDEALVAGDSGSNVRGYRHDVGSSARSSTTSSASMTQTSPSLR